MKRPSDREDPDEVVGKGQIRALERAAEKARAREINPTLPPIGPSHAGTMAEEAVTTPGIARLMKPAMPMAAGHPTSDDRLVLGGEELHLARVAG